MSFDIDIGDVFKAVVTAADAMSGGAASLVVGAPPGTLGTIAAANLGAETIAGEMGGSPAKPASGRPAAPFASSTPQPPLAVQRYTLVGDFLLDTCTGKVWKYDSNEKSFATVPHKLNPLEFLRAQLHTEHMLDFLKARHAEDVLARLPAARLDAR